MKLNNLVWRYTSEGKVQLHLTQEQPNIIEIFLLPSFKRWLNCVGMLAIYVLIQVTWLSYSAMENILREEYIGVSNKQVNLHTASGGRLNKKDGLTRYGDSHVKDKTS